MVLKPLVSLNVINDINLISTLIWLICEGHPESETGPSQKVNVI